MADIELGARGPLACLWVRDAALVAAMTRAGYVMRGDQSAERALRGVNDLAAERAMLERAVARPASILAWPKRRTRTPMKRRIDPAMLESMTRSRWNWHVAEVVRDGAPTFVDARIWRAHASCLVLEDEIELGVRLDWRKKPPGPTMREARRQLMKTFAPFGYVTANVRGVLIVEKSVRKPEEARAERRRIDGFLLR